MNSVWTLDNVNDWTRGPNDDEIDAVRARYGRDPLGLRLLESTNGTSWSFITNLQSSVKTLHPVDVTVDGDDDVYQLHWVSQTAVNKLHTAWNNGSGVGVTNHTAWNGISSHTGISAASDGVDTTLVAFAHKEDDRHPNVLKITNDNGSGTYSVVDSSVSIIGRPGIARTRNDGREVWVYAAVVEASDWDELGEIYVWTSTNDGASWDSPVVMSTTYHSIRGAAVDCDPDHDDCRLAFSRAARPAYQEVLHEMSILFHLDSGHDAVYDAIKGSTMYSAWAPDIAVDHTGTSPTWMMGVRGLSNENIYHRLATGQGNWTGSSYVHTLNQTEAGLGLHFTDDPQMGDRWIAFLPLAD